MKIDGPTRIGVVIHQSLLRTLFRPSDVERLSSLGEVTWTDSEDPLTENAAVELLKECEIGVGSWNTPYPNERMIRECPQLEMWQHVAGSAKHIFGDHLALRPFTIASCKGAMADLVAEMALGMIIMGLRRIPQNVYDNRNVPEGGHHADKPNNVRVLHDSSIGIIGASETGRQLMRLLRPFHCKIHLFDPMVEEFEAAKMGVILHRDLLELCRRCHALTLHTPALPATERLIGRAHFQAMPDDCVFINTSRGICIDQQALTEELQKGRLFAFLDVTEPEPAWDSPLRSLPNVFLTSSLGGPPALNLGRQAVDDIAAYINGDRPRSVLKPEMLDFIA